MLLPSRRRAPVASVDLARSLPARSTRRMRELRSVMDERYRELLAAGRRKVGPEDELPLHLVA